MQEDGRELLSFANSPSYVVDINIEYNGIVTFVGLVLASLILVCLFCCLAYFLIRVGARLQLYVVATGSGSLGAPQLMRGTHLDCWLPVYLVSCSCVAGPRTEWVCLGGIITVCLKEH